AFLKGLLHPAQFRDVAHLADRPHFSRAVAKNGGFQFGVAIFSTLHPIGKVIFGWRILTLLTLLIAFNYNGPVFLGKKIHEILAQEIPAGKSAGAADHFIDKNNAELIIENQKGILRTFDECAIHFFALQKCGFILVAGHSTVQCFHCAYHLPKSRIQNKGMMMPEKRVNFSIQQCMRA
ncbi:MAG: hypothetical protein PHN97_09610, partial [Smithellaceae bacterium]|nr:hypothetical protein [Smithellaceae bacterium]